MSAEQITALSYLVIALASLAAAIFSGIAALQSNRTAIKVDTVAIQAEKTHALVNGQQAPLMAAARAAGFAAGASAGGVLPTEPGFGINRLPTPPESLDPLGRVPPGP